MVVILALMFIFLIMGMFMDWVGIVLLIMPGFPPFISIQLLALSILLMFPSIITVFLGK